MQSRRKNHLCPRLLESRPDSRRRDQLTKLHTGALSQTIQGRPQITVHHLAHYRSNPASPNSPALPCIARKQFPTCSSTLNPSNSAPPEISSRSTAPANASSFIF